jgi:hypothetical protein
LECDRKGSEHIPFVVIFDKAGGAIESPSIDMRPTSRTLLVGNGRGKMAANLLDHQLAHRPVHLCGVGDACLVGRIVELQIQSTEKTDAKQSYYSLGR